MMTDDEYRDAAVRLPGVIVGHDADVIHNSSGAHVDAMVQSKTGEYVEVLVKVYDTSAGDAKSVSADHGGA